MVQQKLQLQKKWKACHVHPQYLFFSPFCIQKPSLWVLFSYSSKETCFQHINMEDLKYRWNEFYCPDSLSSLIEFSQVHVSPNATLTQRLGLWGRRLSRFVSVVVNIGEEFIPLYSLNHTAWNRWLGRAWCLSASVRGLQRQEASYRSYWPGGQKLPELEVDQQWRAAALFRGQTGATERFTLWVCLFMWLGKNEQKTAEISVILLFYTVTEQAQTEINAHTPDLHFCSRY